jgi:hypothetical protein
MAMSDVYSLASLLEAVAGTALVVGGLCIRLAQGPKPRANRHGSGRKSPRPATRITFSDDLWGGPNRVIATAAVRRSARVDVFDLPLRTDLRQASAPLYEQLAYERKLHQAGPRA